jgi:hypothetical protein
MRFLHEMHGENTLWTGSVCPSVRPSLHIIQLENHWTDLDEIWYRTFEHPTIGGNKMRDKESREVDRQRRTIEVRICLQWLPSLPKLG